MKNITIIAGLSASGKSTILAEMVSNYNYTQLITTTTRDPRPNEINGISYHFISKEEFVERRNNGEFLESVEAKGNFYGLRLNEFDKDFGNKKPIIILDPEGVVSATNYLEKNGHKVTSVFIDESPETCIERVKARISSDDERNKRIYDITNVEADWPSFHSYTLRTKPHSSTDDNAKFIDNYNLSHYKNDTSTKKIKRPKP